MINISDTLELKITQLLKIKLKRYYIANDYDKEFSVYNEKYRVNKNLPVFSYYLSELSEKLSQCISTYVNKLTDEFLDFVKQHNLKINYDLITVYIECNPEDLVDIYEEFETVHAYRIHIKY